MTSTGRPWDELEDTLTVPRLEALNRSWLDVPPAHVTSAIAAGYKPASKRPQLSADDPSVRIWSSITASMDQARAAAPPPAGNTSLPAMFPGGRIVL
jgi:hypothetical protein